MAGPDAWNHVNYCVPPAHVPALCEAIEALFPWTLIVRRPDLVGYRLGTDLNRDGLNNDRYIDPNTGEQVHVNAGRGDNTFLFDLRTTKFVSFGGGRQLGLFIELFNVLNTVNHGNLYNGNGRAANFRQPTGYIQSIGYPRQLQLGARFLF